MAVFFDDKNNTLKDGKIKSVKQVAKSIDLDSYVAGIDGEYKAVAYFYNTVKFGRVSDGKLTFADSTEIDMDDLLELRIFNNDAEHHIKLNGLDFDVQVITDESINYNASDADEQVAADVSQDDECIEDDVIEYVDSQSNIFGDCLEVTDGYAKLWEEGRKIALTVPVDEKSLHYALKTRSYITYDKDTNQAGFGYYRFLDIVKAERGE